MCAFINAWYHEDCKSHACMTSCTVSCTASYSITVRLRSIAHPKVPFYMNTKLYKLAILALMSLTVEAASAQSTVVGYCNFVFLPGPNLFENPLENAPDTLDNLFGQNVPDGTTISLWNPNLSSFDSVSEYLNGNWTVDFTLGPGTGAELNTASAFTNTFAGTVLNHDGTVYTGTSVLTPPPVFSGPNGTCLLGDLAPTGDSGTNIFLNILGRLPNVGEQVTTLSGTSTYLGDGAWDNLPTLDVGQAAFLTIESVPEPGAFSLFRIRILCQFVT